MVIAENPPPTVQCILIDSAGSTILPKIAQGSSKAVCRIQRIGVIIAQQTLEPSQCVLS